MPVVIDIAKSVFQAHYVAQETGDIVNRPIKRAEYLEHFVNRAQCLIGMEACGGVHYCARQLTKLGRDVRLIPAKYVKTFNIRIKNEECLMSKQRRTFSPEFKRSAASLVLDQSYSHVDANRSVRVAESVLRRWVQQLHQERHGIPPQSPAMTPEQQRIQELEARVERREREKTIFQKGTALLMSGGIERTK